MPISLTVNGNIYNYPVAGENPDWGSDATDWAKAVTDALATLLGPGDILQSSFSIANNISAATNVNGLIFDPGVIRSANVDYAIYRTSNTNISGYAEAGKLYIVYDDNATIGSKWLLTQKADGNSGVAFSVDDTGQIKYKSTDIGNAGYTGSIRFSAKALSKI
jgi:hypothetical protein